MSLYSWDRENREAAIKVLALAKEQEKQKKL